MSTKNKRREPHMTSSDTTSPILIMGATGRHGGTGTHLARRLREAGRSVRALVRRLDERTAPLQALGAVIVVGDLHDRASLVPALEGVGSAYFAYPVNGGIVQAAANFAAAARQVGGRPPGRRDVRGSFSPREPEPPRSRTVARRRGSGLGRSGSHHPADRVAILRERARVARPIDP